MRSAVVELAAALAVLLVVALIAGPGGKRHPATAHPSWAAKSAAAVTELIGDVTALQRDMAVADVGQPTGSWTVALGSDESRLEQDLAGARALAPPPALGREWSAALSQTALVLQGSTRVLASARGDASQLPTDVRSLDVALADTGGALLALAGSWRS